MKDPEIRATLVSWVRRRRPRDFILHEMQLTGYRSYVDVASIGEHFVGHEIKSDADGVNRLANQVRRYDAVCDFSYLVTTAKLFRRAERAVPAHWGVLVATPVVGAGLEVVREAGPSPARSARALLEMLTKDELVSALRAHGYTGKISVLDKGRAVRAVHETFGADVANRLAMETLRVRRTWTCRQLGVASDEERLAHARRQGSPFICLTTNQT